jgi:hypothetical protein
MSGLPLNLPECYVCKDTGEVGANACPRCRKQERYDQIAARRIIAAKRKADLHPRRFLRHIEEHSKAPLRPYLLLMAMATRCDHRGRVSTAPEILAKVCRCSRRTVFRLIEELEALQELSIIRHGGGKDRPAIYQLGCHPRMSPKLP